MTRTEYYNLYKPDQYDDYDVEQFNDNFDIIDEELHILSEGYEDLGMLGMGYGAVEQVENNVAYCYIPHFRLVKGAPVTVQFNVPLGAGGQLRISSTDPYPIYIQHAQLEDDQITAGLICMLVFDGACYRIISLPA